MKRINNYAYILRTTCVKVEGCVAVDIETTGLSPSKDEILSISIVDEDCNVIFDSLIKPIGRKKWPKATEVNGISPKDVECAPTIVDVCDEVSKVLKSAKWVIAYNADFDRSFLESEGVELGTVPWYDLMDNWAKGWSEWDERVGDYAWVPLDKCAKHYRYKIENAHTSLGDAKATMYCFGRFYKECMEVLPQALEYKKKDDARNLEHSRQMRELNGTSKRSTNERSDFGCANLIVPLFMGICFAVLYFVVNKLFR